MSKKKSIVGILQGRYGNYLGACNIFLDELTKQHCSFKILFNILSNKRTDLRNLYEEHDVSLQLYS